MTSVEIILLIIVCFLFLCSIVSLIFIGVCLWYSVKAAKRLSELTNSEKELIEQLTNVDENISGFAMEVMELKNYLDYMMESDVYRNDEILIELHKKIRRTSDLIEDFYNKTIDNNAQN